MHREKETVGRTKSGGITTKGAKREGGFATLPHSGGDGTVSRNRRPYSVYLGHARVVEDRARDLLEAGDRSGSGRSGETERTSAAGKRRPRGAKREREKGGGRKKREKLRRDQRRGGEQAGAVAACNAVRYTCTSATATILHRVGAVVSSLGDLGSDLPLPLPSRPSSTTSTSSLLAPLFPFPPAPGHERVPFLFGGTSPT